MANIQFQGVQRVFRQGGKDFVALQDINLEVRGGVNDLAVQIGAISTTKVASSE